MILTHQQQRLIETTAHSIPPARREEFSKFVADVLRGRVELRDTDIWHATHEALRRYSNQAQD